MHLARSASPSPVPSQSIDHDAPDLRWRLGTTTRASVQLGGAAWAGCQPSATRYPLCRSVIDVDHARRCPRPRLRLDRAGGLLRPPTAEPIASSRVQVLDGDTIRIDGRQLDVRLVGFNTPEATRAQCATERDLGEVAARRRETLGSPTGVPGSSSAVCLPIPIPERPSLVLSGSRGRPAPREAKGSGRGDRR
jgi:hypothetical protein